MLPLDLLVMTRWCYSLVVERVIEAFTRRRHLQSQYTMMIELLHVESWHTLANLKARSMPNSVHLGSGCDAVRLIIVRPDFFDFDRVVR